MRKRSMAELAFLALAFLAIGDAYCQGRVGSGLSIETSVVDPFFSIFFVRCHLDLTPRDALLFGAYYLRTDKTFSGQAYPGNYQGIAPIIGYRRFLVGKIYLEYQLLPMYAVYHESDDGSDAKGFELWNELHLGYRLDFTILNFPLFINLQGSLGFCLLKTDEPRSFANIEATDPAYYFPNFYVLPNILLGIRLR